MKGKVHLIGHYSRTFRNYVVSACGYFNALSAHNNDHKRFTTDPKEVTCKVCLRLLHSDQELDRITRMDPAHPSCVPNPRKYESTR